MSPLQKENSLLYSLHKTPVVDIPALAQIFGANIDLFVNDSTPQKHVDIAIKVLAHGKIQVRGNEARGMCQLRRKAGDARYHGLKPSAFDNIWSLLLMMETFIVVATTITKQ